MKIISDIYLCTHVNDTLKYFTLIYLKIHLYFSLIIFIFFFSFFTEFSLNHGIYINSNTYIRMSESSYFLQLNMPEQNIFHPYRGKIKSATKVY